jgi:hypothetical protein
MASLASEVPNKSRFSLVLVICEIIADMKGAAEADFLPARGSLSN